MRELKFRAFIENEMVMLPMAALQYFDFEGAYALSFVVDAYPEFWAHECYEVSSKKCKDAPIMQFINRKDKNGTDIYEGDIMIGPFGTGNGGKSTKYKQLKFSVIYSEHTSKFTIKLPEGVSQGAYRFLPSFEESEVIGNIYQPSK
jgi:uncharacterized phage protein (TIGR01671 family)